MKAALRVLVAVIAIVALGVGATFLVVWVYSTFFRTGRPMAEYEQFAQVAGPWVSVILGPLITYAVVRAATRKLDFEAAKRAAVWIMGLYLLIDLAVLVGAGPSLVGWGFALVSIVGRSLGAWYAVRKHN